MYSSGVSDDWAYCQQALRTHSRTFAIPIALLPDPIDRVVTCAYLLCRAADTIEDTAAWSPTTKERLFRALLDVMGDGAGPEALGEFRLALERAPFIEGRTPKLEELELLSSVDRVLRVFETAQPGLQRECRAWVCELTRGMAIYAQRRQGQDGIACLVGMADLERYCYFVAGTIGRLLTAIFVELLGPLEPVQERRLHAHAERFGAGLQLVNILRDVAEDLERRWSFIPRVMLAEQGMAPLDLLSPHYSDKTRRVLEPIFDAARSHLDSALEYCLALPAQHVAVRRFVLIPLWLAVCTLGACRRAPELVSAGHKVKLERGRVAELVAECTALAADDDALRRAFTRLG